MAIEANRYDRIIKVRAREEETARLALADAVGHHQAAERTVEAARVKAHHDDRARGHAAHWLLSDRAHAVARDRLSHAESKLMDAMQTVDTARSSHIDASQKLQAFERLADKRREQAAVEERRREQAAFDDFAIMMYARG